MQIQYASESGGAYRAGACNIGPQEIARRRQSGLLAIAFTVAVAAVALAFPYLGALAALFGFVPLPLSLAAATIGIVGAYILSTEVVKIWFFRHKTRLP